MTSGRKRGTELVLQTKSGAVTIVGNAHTFHGHFLVRTLDGDRVAMSTADITGGSPPALAWVDGFLAGNEPSLGEFLGVSDEEADDADDAQASTPGSRSSVPFGRRV